MKSNSLRLLLSTLFVLVAASASASLLFYDGFDYTSGQYLAPRTDTTGTPDPGLLNVEYNVNWRYAGAGAAANNAPTIASGGLVAPGALGQVGNSVSFDPTQIGSARIQISPTAINSGTVYWSALLQVNSLGTLNNGNGMLLGGFNNTPGAGALPGAVGAVLRIRTDPVDSSKYDIGTAMNSGTGAGNIQFSSSGYSVGDTIFVIAAYNFVAGSANDTAQMWINPNVADFGAALPPAATLTSAPALADSFTSLSTFNLRNVNTVGNPSVLFDELRVGTTWADVTTVPEPATSALLGIGALLFFGWRRSRS